MIYKRILISVDGSDTSNRALNQAIALCRDMQARLRILHVVDSGRLFVADGAYVDIQRLEEAFSQAGNKLLTEAAATAKAAGVTADTQIAQTESPNTRIAEVIVREAKEWQADLIVLGTHGRRGLSHFVLGSVAEGVARSASVPVLLVRGG